MRSSPSVSYRSFGRLTGGSAERMMPISAGCADETPVTRRLAALASLVWVLGGCGGSVPQQRGNATVASGDGPAPASGFEPTAVVDAFYEAVRRGRGLEAVRSHWQTGQYARRIYGASWDLLGEADAAMVVDELERSLAVVYESPSFVAAFKHSQIINLSETRDGNSAIVRFDVRNAPGQGETRAGEKHMLVEHDGRWWIADMMIADKDVWTSAAVRGFCTAQSQEGVACARWWRQTVSQAISSAGEER